MKFAKKKSSTRVAIGALILASSLGAVAQSTSNVTLSGQIGAGVTVVDHQGASAGRVSSVGDNLMWASLLRISGVEDIGGGTKALFRLEAGLNPDSGTQANGSKFWNRQSFVGLQSGPHTITLGRQFHAHIERAVRTLDINYLAGSNLAATPLAVIGTNRFGAAATGNGMDSRADNSVKYRFTVPGTIDIGASVAAGEAGTAGRSHAFDIARTTADYDIAAAFAHYENGTANPDGHVAAEDFWAIGGSVKIGAFRPYASFYNNKIEASTNANAGVSLLGGKTQKNQIVALGLAWQASVQTRFTAAFYSDRGRNLNGLASRQGFKRTAVLAGYYSLSKRTELYAAAYTNRFSGGYVAEGVNLAGLGRTAATDSASGLSTGLRHSF